MDVSKFLGKAIGLYLMILGLCMLFNMEQFITNIGQLIKEPTLMFVSGFFTLILGIIMVVSHNKWQWSWRVIITILAWMSLIKGLSLVLYPQPIDKTTLYFIQNSSVMYVASAFDFVLGAILFYFGFRQD
jgi:uncharacterized membrane protein